MKPTVCDEIDNSNRTFIFNEQIKSPQMCMMSPNSNDFSLFVPSINGNKAKSEKWSRSVRPLFIAVCRFSITHIFCLRMLPE